MKKIECDYKILLVEDDENQRETLGRILSRFFHIKTAFDGVDGFKIFKSYKPDIIITDISMPNKNGIDMIKNIKKVDKDVIIIIHSELSDKEYLFSAIELGVNNFINKPTDGNLLIEKINSHIKTLDLKKNLTYTKKLLEEYKNAVDRSNLVSKTDINGIITYVNDEFCKMSGYSKDELIGANHNLIKHTDMKGDTFKELWKTILSKNVWQGVVKNRKKDGSSYYVDATVLPILDIDNEIVEFIAIRKDITELHNLNTKLEKRVEEEVAKNFKKDKEYIKLLKNLLESSPNPVIVYKNSKVKFFNNELLKLLPNDMDITNTEFKLESIFEDKSTSILEDLKNNFKIDNNLVSIIKNEKRKFYAVLKDDIDFADDMNYRMITLNDVTKLEFQKLRIQNSNDRLESYIRRLNKQKVAVDTKETKTETVVSEKLSNNKVKISVSRSEEIRFSRDEKYDSMALFSMLDDTYVDKIEQFFEELDQMLVILYDFSKDDPKKNYNNMKIIVESFNKFYKIVDTFLIFSVMVSTFKNLALFLDKLEESDYENVQRMDILVENLIGTIKDLEQWIEIVFIKKLADNVNYLDASFANNVLEIESMFNNEEIVVDDEDDLEFF